VILNQGGDTLPLASLDLTIADASVLAEALADVVEDAVLLIHSGAALLPDAFATTIDVLHRQPIDGLQPAGQVDGGQGPLPVPPLGGSAAFGLFEGPTYAGSLIVRREALLAATAGRPLIADSPFLGVADLCVTHGLRIWPSPLVAVTLPPGGASMPPAATAGRLAAYAGAGQQDRYQMIGVGYAASTQPRPVFSKLGLASEASRLGLSQLVRVGAWGWRRLRRWAR
jgi:hypothetical protein